MQVLLIALAGALGSVARYGVGVGVARSGFAGNATAILLVNVLGSAGFGLVAALAAGGALAPETRVVLATGFLGGFTTYSSFNDETLGLVAAGQPLRAAGYVAATVASCLAAGAAAMALARR